MYLLINKDNIYMYMMFINIQIKEDNNRDLG